MLLLRADVPSVVSSAGRPGQHRAEYRGGRPSPVIAAEGDTAPHRCVYRRQLRRRVRSTDPVHPVRRRPDRPIGQMRETARVQPVPQPRPAPVFRLTHETRPQGVPLHVPADGQEMLVGRHRKRLEPALVQRTGAHRPMGVVPAHGVSHRQSMHEHGQIPFGLWPEHEMPMIRHQAKRQQPHRHRLAGGGELLLERRVIGR